MMNLFPINVLSCKHLCLLLGVVSILLALPSCRQQTHDKQKTKKLSYLTPSEQEAYIERGKKLASLTFTELSGQLQKALQEGGVQAAVKYCNIAALPITDSLSNAHQATIRRSSNRYRNPANTSTLEEAQVIKDYLLDDDAGYELKPIIKENEDHSTVRFYAPIRTMPLCLNCHGTVGKEMKEDDYGIIKDLYPEDKAFGYSNGDLRGIWSISFRRTAD